MPVTRATVRWAEGHSVGVAELDEQHRKLFDTMNELDQAVHDAQGSSAIDSILDRLVDYAIPHFASEEALMESCRFPGLREHRRQRIAGYVVDHKAGQAGVPVELLFFMQTWLKKHVLEMDQKYTPYVHARGLH